VVTENLERLKNSESASISKSGVDIHHLATQMGTSTLMIERHYSHLIARMRSASLAGGRW
jgi:integrase